MDLAQLDVLDEAELAPDAIACKKLWATVLDQGLREAAAAIRFERGGKARVIGHETWNPKRAIRWLNSDDASHVGAFVALCDLFDLDPEAVRASVYAQWRTL